MKIPGCANGRLFATTQRPPILLPITFNGHLGVGWQQPEYFFKTNHIHSQVVGNEGPLVLWPPPLRAIVGWQGGEGPTNPDHLV